MRVREQESAQMWGMLNEAAARLRREAAAHWSVAPTLVAAMGSVLMTVEIAKTFFEDEEGPVPLPGDIDDEPRAEKPKRVRKPKPPKANTPDEMADPPSQTLPGVTDENV